MLAVEYEKPVTPIARRMGFSLHAGFSRRALRGLAIVARGKQIRRIGGGLFFVKSQSDPSRYHIIRRDTAPQAKWSCDCKDYRKRREPCKHVYAVMFLLALPDIVLMNLEALEGGQNE